MRMIKATATACFLLTGLFVVHVWLRHQNGAATSVPQDTDAAIDSIFSWVRPGGPGCAVAASQNGKVVVNRGYGLANLERQVPITSETAFDVGSVIKQFAAAAVLLLVEEKRVSLSDDIRKHLPELPDYGHKVTVDHLLTHTGGIRDWLDALPLRPGETALTVTLRRRDLDFPPGEKFAYSNGGYELVKEIVARITGMPFGDFARRRLFDPLGMTSSAYLADGVDVPNLALAYEKAWSDWRQSMMLGGARGVGALFSTAPDLVIWNDALTSGRLGTFVTQKIQEPARLKSGKPLHYARGLYLQSTEFGHLVWHGGSAAAYKTAIGRLPERRLSIAVLCNAGEASDDRTKFAARILQLLVRGTVARS